MKVSTKNYYGKISIYTDAIASVAGFAAIDCYGVVDIVSKSFIDSVKELFKKQQYLKGVRVKVIDNKIFIAIHAIFKYGVSINAVSESLKKSVKYSVENFTGMVVNSIDVHVEGVRV